MTTPTNTTKIQCDDGSYIECYHDTKTYSKDGERIDIQDYVLMSRLKFEKTEVMEKTIAKLFTTHDKTVKETVELYKRQIDQMNKHIEKMNPDDEMIDRFKGHIDRMNKYIERMQKTSNQSI